MTLPASPTAQLDRSRLLSSLAQAHWDVVVIGGGATGLGTAVDAAPRGFRTLLVEAADFAKGTSSRATKLVHGGVRYLAQGNISLVREALRERGLLHRNAPHLAWPLGFVVPAYRYADQPFYGIGLKTIGISPVLLFGAAVLFAVGLTCAHWLRRHPTPV